MPGTRNGIFKCCGYIGVPNMNNLIIKNKMSGTVLLSNECHFV